MPCTALHKKRPVGHIHQQQRAESQWPPEAPSSPEVRATSRVRRRRRLMQSNIKYTIRARAHAHARVPMRISMRMLYGSVIARAPASPLQFQTRLLAPKTPNINARTSMRSLEPAPHMHMPHAGSGRAGAGRRRRHDNHHGNHRHVRPAMEGGIPAASLMGRAGPFVCCTYLDLSDGRSSPRQANRRYGGRAPNLS